MPGAREESTWDAVAGLPLARAAYVDSSSIVIERRVVVVERFRTHCTDSGVTLLPPVWIDGE
jgi:hypothetical protein